MCHDKCCHDIRCYLHNDRNLIFLAVPDNNHLYLGVCVREQVALKNSTFDDTLWTVVAY